MLMQLTVNITLMVAYRMGGGVYRQRVSNTAHFLNYCFMMVS